MRARVVLLAVSLISAAGTFTPSSAFNLTRSRTEAAVATSVTGAPAIQLRFSAELINGLPDLRSSDVAVGWQEVGGISPSPFRVLIPAGCFAGTRRGVKVGNHLACGVSMGVGTLPVTILDFAAKIVPRDDGTFRFDILTTLIPPDPIHPSDPIRAFLGLVGGAAVEIGIGSETSMSPPLRAETVSGIDPSPF